MGKRLSRDSWAVAGIFFLALVVRLVYLYESSDNPTFTNPVVDGQTYDELARHLAGGGGLATKHFWQGWMYPLFLSGVYFLSGNSIIVAKVVQLVLGGATCVLVYFLGRKIFNRRVGLGGGIIVAVYGPLIFFEGELLATGWIAFWSVALVLLFMEAISKKSLRLCFLLGLCGSLSVLTKATFLPFLLAGYIFLLYRFYGRGGGLRRAGGALLSGLAGFLLIGLPGAWLCYRYAGHFSLTPHGAGVNLYVGNNPDYCETATARPGWEWEKITTIPVREGVRGDVWEKGRYFKQKVLDYARSEPLKFIGGLASKTLRFFSSREIPRNVEIYLFGRWSQFIRFSVWKQWGFGFPFGVLLPLTVVGMVYCRRQLSAPVALFLFLYSLAIILVFVAARYRVVIVPVMSVYASAGLGALVGMLRGRQWGRISLAVVIMGGAVLAASLPGAFCEEEVDYEAELHYCLGFGKFEQGRTDEALVLFGEALRLRDDFPDVHNLQGIIFEEEGNFDAALAEFHKTLSQSPGYADAYTNIGNICFRQDKYEEAIEWYEQALRLRPFDPEMYDDLGQAFHRVGGLVEAITHYRRSLALGNGDPDVRRNLAEALLENGEDDEAVKEFIILTGFVPGEAPAHYDLAVLLAEYGKLDSAADHYRKALAARRDWPAAHYKLGLVLTEQGKRQEAIEEYQEAVRLKSNYSRAHKSLADELMSEGRAVEAVSHYRSVLAVKGDWVEALNDLAWILATSKEAAVRDGEEAVRLAEKACALTEHKDGQALDTLAAAYAAVGRYDEAVATVTKAIDLAAATGQEDTVGEYRKRLELYRARRPYIQTDVSE